MERALRVLMVEDAPADAELIERELRKANLICSTKRVETRDGFLREIREFAPDLILSDYALPEFDGMTALRLARELAAPVPFIMVTGSLDEETAVECIKSGAADYVIKEHLVRLGPAVKSALERKQARDAKEQAEEKLHRSEELFRRIVQAAGEGIWMTDEGGMTTFANEKMAEMLGCAPENLIGRPVFDFLPDDGREAFQAKLAQCRRGVAERYDWKFRRCDGRDLWAMVSATPTYDSRGEFAGALKMVTDITERKEFEKALAGQAAALARSNAELEEFAHAAAHDLQEPLRTVASFVQLLAARCTGRLEPQEQKYIELAVEGVQRMREQIQGLLTYSEVTFDRGPARADAEQALRSALANLRAAIEESEACVTNDPLPTVRMDPLQLCRLFQNLIENAIKFRRAQPPRIHVAAEWKPGEWVLSVRDNGIGIEPHHAARIFAMFRRLHRRTEYPGSGLGLAICRKIVERHGGRIWLESEVGRGSVFYFSAPPAAPSDPPSPAHQERPPRNHC